MLGEPTMRTAWARDGELSARVSASCCVGKPNAAPFTSDADASEQWEPGQHLALKEHGPQEVEAVSCRKLSWSASGSIQLHL